MWPLLVYPPSKHIYRNNKRQTAHNRICEDCLNDSAKQFFTTTTIVLTSVTVAHFCPIIEYFRNGSLITIYQIHFPFIDDPYLQFVVGIMFQGMISTTGALGLALIESGMSMVNNTLTVSSKLNALSLHEFSEKIKTSQINGKQCRHELKLIFMNILYWDK